MILDAVSGEPVDAKSIKDGSTVYAWLGAQTAMTMSLPPQVTPELLLVNVPADYKVPQYDVIVRSDGLTGLGIPNRSGMSVTLSDGTVYQGCNIENASYSPTVCAERTAFFKAVYDGHRDFAAIAVCGGKDGVITGAFPPCGVCRQVMREFCDDDFPIYMITPEGYEAHTQAEILPFSFSAQKHMHA